MKSIYSAICGALSLVLLLGCVTTESPTNSTSLTIDPKPESSIEGREPELARELVLQADERFAAKDYESALFLYQEALEFEDAAAIWLRLGDTHKKLQANSRALQAYTNSLERKPEQPLVYQQIGLLYLNNGKPDASRKNLERALAIDDSLWRSWNGLGVAADLEKKFDLGQEHYRQAITLQPDSPMLWSNLGYSQYLSGNYTAAELSFEAALTKDSKFKPAWMNLGLVHARKAEYTNAIEILTQLQSVPVAYNDVGYIALLNEDWDSAQHLLQRAIDLAPTYYVVAHKNMELLNVRRDQQVLAAVSAQDEVSAAESASAAGSHVGEPTGPVPGTGLVVGEHSTVAIADAVDEEESATWLSTNSATDSAEKRSDSCIDSQFPGPCAVCQQTPNPALCMLGVLKRYGSN